MVNNRDLFDAKGAIEELLERELPYRTALKLRQIARRVNQRLEDVEGERQKLLSRYAQSNGDGNFKVDDEGIVVFRDRVAQVEFQKGFLELSEVEWEDAPVLKASELAYPDPDSCPHLPAKLLFQLGDLFEDDVSE